MFGVGFFVGGYPVSCDRARRQAGAAAVRSGIAPTANRQAYEVGYRGEAGLYLPGALKLATPGWPNRQLWRDYRTTIKAALKNWRSKRDDRTLVRLRAELGADLAGQVVSAEKDKRKRRVEELAGERARLLLNPPRSLPVGERVERVAVLDNALALLRLKRVINEDAYREAVIDTLLHVQNRSKTSAAPVGWLPHRPAGIAEESAGEADPTRKVQVRYRLVALNEPVVSNLANGTVNPAYDHQLQPRRRDRKASLAQIERLAGKLDTDELLKAGAGWADGPPLVGPDGMVESGNGRLLAMRRAVETNPQAYAEYRHKLKEQAARFGLRRPAVARMARPVLVRERLTEMSAEQRRQFVNEANAGRSARMGVAEQARADAGLIPPGFFADLQTTDSDRSLAGTLSKKSNAPVVARFLKLLPETEQAALVDSRGQLSIDGAARLERALFAYAMPGAAGERLARLVYEAGEAIDRVGAGVRQALPQLGQLEDLIRAGQRARSLSLGDDLAASVEKLRDIHRLGLSVDDYLRQHKMFETLTPLQEQLLAQLDQRRRSGRATADLIKAYVDAALKTASPHQAALFGGRFQPDRSALLRAAVKKGGNG